MAIERVRDHVELRVARDLPLIDADPAQLERAFANVVENAVKHAGERMVQVRAARVGERVVVRVVDQGRGIPAAERERIFEAFERGADAARPVGHRARAGDRQGLRRGQRRPDHGRVGAGAGHVVRHRLPGPAIRRG